MFEEMKILWGGPRWGFSCSLKAPRGGQSVTDPDPGSGAFLTPGPGSGIRNRFFPDPGSQTHIFELSDKFLGKKFYNFFKTGQIFFFSISKIK